jgi:hypothetical protein
VVSDALGGAPLRSCSNLSRRSSQPPQAQRLLSRRRWRLRQRQWRKQRRQRRCLISTLVALGGSFPRSTSASSTTCTAARRSARDAGALRLRAFFCVASWPSARMRWAFSAALRFCSRFDSWRRSCNECSRSHLAHVLFLVVNRQARVRLRRGGASLCARSSLSRLVPFLTRIGTHSPDTRNDDADRRRRLRRRRRPQRPRRPQQPRLAGLVKQSNTNIARRGSAACARHASDIPTASRHAQRRGGACRRALHGSIASEHKHTRRPAGARTHQKMRRRPRLPWLTLRQTRQSARFPVAAADVRRWRRSPCGSRSLRVACAKRLVPPLHVQRQLQTATIAKARADELATSPSIVASVTCSILNFNSSRWRRRFSRLVRCSCAASHVRSADGAARRKQLSTSAVQSGGALRRAL